MEASQVADVIIKRFIEKGKAQGSRNYFGYVDSYPDGIIVSRENGQDTKISKTNLIVAIEAVRQEPSIYDKGPTALRPYITRRIQSPLWALLQLASIDEIISKSDAGRISSTEEKKVSTSKKGTFFQDLLQMLKAFLGISKKKRNY